MPIKKKEMGRPKEDLSSLPDNWKDEVLECYNVGGSDEEIKAKIYIWRNSFSNDLWDRWMKEEPNFSETIKKGRVLSSRWWLKEGRSNLKDKEFNYTGWYMNMKNRFGWADKKEIKQENTNKNMEVTVDSEKQKRIIDDLFKDD